MDFFTVKIKQYSLVFSLLLLVWNCHRVPVTKINGHTMGTTYHIKIAEPLFNQISKESVKQSIDSLLTTINQQMSTFLDSSEISQFNRWPSDKSFKISRPFLEVVRKALQIYEMTQGAFDITVAPLVRLWGFGNSQIRFEPPDSLTIAQILTRVGSRKLRICGDSALCKQNPELQIDLGAIAKGYAVDAICELLWRRKIKNFLVEIGGELYASGQNWNRPWLVGVEHPQYHALPGAMVDLVLKLHNCAVATSGDYRNFFEYQGTIYSHEIDPHTGWPVSNGLASVTVIAPNCLTADALATAIMIMGEKAGLNLVNRLKEVETLILKRKKDGQLEYFYSSGFKGYLKN